MSSTPPPESANDPQTESNSNGGSHSNLTWYIAGAIVLAIVFALVAPEVIGPKRLGEDSKLLPGIISGLELGGEIFLNLLKMMVVPLVVSSVMAGILGLGDIRKLGRPGGYAVLYYISTTFLAVAVGLVVVNIINPGEGFDQGVAAEASAPDEGEQAEIAIRKAIAEESGLSESAVANVFPNLPDPEAKPSVSAIAKNLVLMLFTDNLLKSALESDLLPLIVFSIVFAGMLTTMGERVENITRLVEQINHAFLHFVLLLMSLAPIGIFCLVAGRFGEASLNGEFWAEIQKIGWYMTTVLTGLAIHAFVTIPFIFWVFTKKNPYRFMLHMGQALLTAFSTASSSATLPVTMENAVENAGVSRRSVDFVLPLGATINMDGTALYEAAAAIFIAQAIGVDLSLGQQLIVALTATLAAIGAAGIPEAGLFTMVIVLNAVGLPIEAVGLVLSVDWLLDRFRTTVNVFGDAAGSAIIQDTFPPDAPETATISGEPVPA